MTIRKIIDGLYFTIGMILFNPLTGESKTPDQLNEDDRTTYDACMGAITLLKVQEPRVLTLDELRMNEVYWAEQDNILRPWPIALHHIRNAGLLDGPVYQDWMGENYNTKEYGRKWRCWTSRPDEKRRSETPWN